MKTNLLAQNDNLVIENLKADVGKSVFDLSHSVTFPIDVNGAILPICCIETLPSDSFDISVECLLRQLTPLKVPLMTNFRLNTAFYYCDNRLAWKKWDRFMTGGRSGNEVYDIPRVANIRYSKSQNPDKYDLLDNQVASGEGFIKGNLKNMLHTYFGISLNHNEQSRESYDNVTDYSSELPVAFPFFDYQLICRDYYTNVDRLPKSKPANVYYSDYDNLDADWYYDAIFPVDDDEIRLVDGVQIRSGFNSGDDYVQGTKGFLLDKVRYHDVRDDYFTSSKPAPMRGTPPALTAESTLVLPNGTRITLDKGENNTPLLGQTWDDDNTIVPGTAWIPNYEVSSEGRANHLYTTNGSQNVHLNSNATGNRKVVADLNGVNVLDGYTVKDVELKGLLHADWTAADIRLLSQLSVWQELNMLHEPYYDDFLNAHFDNVRVGESAVEKPQYIGGTSQLISINEVLQTSESTNGNPLGQQGATAMSLASNHVGKYYSNNYGYIIGVAYIIPDLLYKPAMPRTFSHRTKEDYYSPEFANLSMQAVLNKEIFFSNDNDWNNSPWGYVGAFDELRSIPNRIAGDLLNSNYSDLGDWVLTREMSNDNKPAMIHNWLSLKGNVKTDAWQVQYDPGTSNPFPKFMLQCANYIKAVRPMPKVAIPKAL